MSAEAAGAAWCERFPGSVSLDDLIDPFKAGAKGFIGAMRDAGLAVRIGATYRPPERAYLMHYACLVAGYTDAAEIFHQISPKAVPRMLGVLIDWTCGGDLNRARAAAAEMVAGYRIQHPAALVSRHTERRAVDMTITFPDRQVSVATRNGNLVPASKLTDLAPIGATWGVMKLATDPPHWSDDGH